MTKPPPPKDDRPFYIGVGLAVAVALVFGRALRHAFIPYDDDWYVYANPIAQQGFTLESIRWAFTATGIAAWHPVTLLTHILDCQLFGLRAGLHHAMNLVWHGANTLLLFHVLRRMTGALWPSACVAALFALHPLHVESVAWIAERKDLVSTFFMLLSLWAYVAYAERGGAWRYALIVIAFALGLMAKSMLVTLPFAMLLLDVWPLNRWGGDRGKSFGALVAEKTPLFALSALFIAITLAVQPPAETLAIGLPVRLANTVVAYGTYLYKSIWPARLAVVYPYSAVNIVPWKIAASALALIVLTVWVVLRRRAQPYLAVGWCWFLGTLLPVSGIVQISDHAMADRYTYVPYIGLFIAVVWAAFDVGARRPRLVKPLQVAGALAIAALAAVSFVQLGHWRDGERLFRHAIAVTHDNVKMHNNLGVIYMGQNRYGEAQAQFEAALASAPDHVESENNLGATLLSQGKAVEAERLFRDALAKTPGDPSVHLNLAVALSEQKRIDEARASANEALVVAPGYEPAQRFLVRLGDGRPTTP